MPHLSISRLPRRISGLLILAASLGGSCVTAFSAEVGLAWDAKTEPDLAGYRIYYGVASQSYGAPVDVGNVTTYRVTGLDPGSYYFCVTAYYASGNETSCSNEVSVILLPPMYGFRDGSASSQLSDAFSARIASVQHPQSSRERALSELHSSLKPRDRLMAGIPVWRASGFGCLLGCERAFVKPPPALLPFPFPPPI